MVNKVKALQVFLPEEMKQAFKVLMRVKYWEQKSIIFVHVPKVAGASVNYALYGRFMGHFTASQIRRYAPKTFQSYPSFAITRNPWARCVSAYRFAKAGEGQSTGLIAAIHNREKYNIPAFESFERFVKEWLINQDINKVDFVFRPQLPFISDRDGNIIVSHVGKLEDMKSVQSYISSTLGEEIIIGHENSTGRKVTYHKWYTPELIELVASVYKSDIEAFGFTFE